MYTGAPCGISGKKYLRNIKHYGIQKTQRQFSSYTGHPIPSCLGRIPVLVKLGQTVRKLNLYVMDGEFDPLFGREWIAHFVNEINWSELFSPSDRINSMKMSNILTECCSTSKVTELVIKMSGYV